MPDLLPDRPPSAAADDFGEMPSQQLRQRVKRRLAALSLVGALMVALPLLQVLRYQAADLQALIGERAALDPAALAVDVERSLLAHRTLAAQVLLGQPHFDAERTQRQGEVDSRMATLAAALMTGPWERALAESEAMRDDWALLTRRIIERSIAAADSNLGHRLLVEQTLQVIDLVADVPGLQSRWRDDAVRAGVSAALTLPRLAGLLAELDRSGPADADPLGAAERAAARARSTLQAAVAASPQPALTHAAASAGAATDRYLQLLRGSDADAAARAGAATAALAAQFAVFDLLAAQVRGRLDDQIERAHWSQHRLIAATLVLGLLALAMLARLLRLLHAPHSRPPLSPPTPTTPTQSASPAAAGVPSMADHERREAGRLMTRLRAGDEPRPGTVAAPSTQSDRSPGAAQTTGHGPL